MANIRQTNLIDLVPESIKSDPQVQAAAAAINNELQAVTAAIPATVLIARLDELPEAVIDLLAWQWHVDYYEPVGIDFDTKRKLVRQSIAWHRRKGTPSVVKETVSAVLGSGKVYEWFGYGGQPYHFRVECSDTIQDGQTLARLWQLINSVKNTRSWCEAIQVRQETWGTLYLGGAVHTGDHITIYPVATNIENGDQQTYFGQAMRVAEHITIYPEAI